MCDALLTALTGTWKSPTPNRASIGGRDITYGASLSFIQPPVVTKSRFLLSEMSSWPAGQEGKKGMHYDVGVVKCLDEETVQWSMAHNFGGTEIASGRVAVDAAGHISVRLKSTSIGGASSFSKTQRSIFVSNPDKGKGRSILSQVFAIDIDGEMNDHLFESYEKHKVKPE
jgi:hypothetical protein